MSSDAKTFFDNRNALNTTAEMISDGMKRERIAEMFRHEDNYDKNPLDSSKSLRHWTRHNRYFPYHIADTLHPTIYDYCSQALECMEYAKNVISGTIDVNTLDMLSLESIRFYLSIPDSSDMWPHVVDFAQYIYHSSKFADILYFHGIDVPLPAAGSYGFSARNPLDSSTEYLYYHHRHLYDIALELKSSEPIRYDFDGDFTKEALVVKLSSGGTTWFLPYLSKARRIESAERYKGYLRKIKGLKDQTNTEEF